LSRFVAGLLVVVVGAIGQGETRAQDPGAAERQYRMARRLAAEGSPEAASALQKVIELDPAGKLADDALVEQALFEGIARWPEDLGRIGTISQVRARAFLDAVLNDHATSDRAPEARYLQALLRLEPLPGHDPSGGRQDLILVATAPERSGWPEIARYAVAWLDEQQGHEQRAQAGYQRLLVDAPGSDAARRARVGLARLLIRAAEFGEAAHWLQQAIDGGVAEHTGARALRELASRHLVGLGLPGAGSQPEITMPTPEPRSVVGVGLTPGGAIVVAGGKPGGVFSLAADGTVRSSWSLDGVSAVVVNAMGRVFAVAGDQAYRLDPDQQPRTVGGLGAFAEPSALAADPLGRLFVLDRRRESIGRLDPGAAEPVRVWEGKGAKVAAIVWDGRRLVAVHGKQKQLIAIDPDGGSSPLGPVFLKPSLVAADVTGRLAVLDAKEGTVSTLDALGTRVGQLDWRALGLKDPVGLAFGPDGALHLVDRPGARWVRFP
jgi:hypothetical protein